MATRGFTAAARGGGRPRSDGRWPWMLFQVWHEEQKEGLDQGIWFGL